MEGPMQLEHPPLQEVDPGHRTTAAVPFVVGEDDADRTEIAVAAPVVQPPKDVERTEGRLQAELSADAGTRTLLQQGLIDLDQSANFGEIRIRWLVETEDHQFELARVDAYDG